MERDKQDVDSRFVEFHGILSLYAQEAKNFTIIQIGCEARSHAFLALHHHGIEFSQ